MKNKTQKHFSKYGYLLKSGLYASDISRYEVEFDKIIKQLKEVVKTLMLVEHMFNKRHRKHEDFCNSHP